MKLTFCLQRIIPYRSIVLTQILLNVSASERESIYLKEEIILTFLSQGESEGSM